MKIDPLLAYVGLAACLIAAASDVRKHKIFNWLTFPLIAAGPVAQLWLHGAPGLLSSVLGMGFMLAALLIMFFTIGINFGGGDIKLLMALGGLLGWPLAASLMVYTGIAGAVVAVPVLIYHHRLRHTMTNLVVNYLRHESGESEVTPTTGTAGIVLPYGVCILLGMAVLVFRGPLFI